jgi:hypothetical protein
MRGKKTGGRKKGTPNKSTAEIKNLAQSHGAAAINRLAEMGGLVPGVEPALSEQSQIAACNEVLDRAYGRPTQPHGNDAEHPLVPAAQLPFTPSLTPIEADAAFRALLESL